MGYSKGAVRVVEDGEVIQQLADFTVPITAICVLPNAETVFISDALGSLYTYRTTNNELVLDHQIKHIVAKGGHRAPAAVKASKDSKVIAFVGPTEHCVTLLNSNTLNCLIKMDVASAASGCLDTVHSVSFGTISSRDVFVTTQSGKVLIVDSRTGTITAVHQPHASGQMQLVTTDEYIVAAAGNRFSVFEYKEFGEPAQQYVTSDPAFHISFTPDHEYLITSGNFISIWNFFGRKPVTHSTDYDVGANFKDNVDTKMEDDSPKPSPPIPTSLDHVESDLRFRYLYTTYLNDSNDITSSYM